MVPRHDVLNFNLNSETLLCLRFKERKCRIADCAFTVVLESDCSTNGQDLVVVLNDGGCSDDLKSLEFFVSIATFNQTGDLVIATQVDDLLALAESPECHFAVHDLVPHGHQMRVSGRPDRRNVENGLSVEVGRNFGLGHRDGSALICHIDFETSSPSHDPRLLDAIHPPRVGLVVGVDQRVCATVETVVATPSPDLLLEPLSLEADAFPARKLSEWLTTFHLASVVLDPYTNESSWILPAAARILRAFGDSAARTSLIVTANADQTRSFLGPLTKEFLVFTDPDRAAVKAFGLTTLPAFVFVRSDGTIPAVAEGWDGVEWRKVAKAIADTTAWTAPSIPAAGDPVSFSGTPALG